MLNRGDPCLNYIPPQTAQKQRALVHRILFQDRHDEYKSVECIEPYDAGEVGIGSQLCGHFSVQRQYFFLIQTIFVVWPGPKQLDCANHDDTAGPTMCPTLE